MSGAGVEFDLIRRCFGARGARREEVLLGPGDDAALVRCGTGTMAICADTLVAGTHFPSGHDPFDVGHKALAVSLSDLAAIGARPLWATLCLTHPDGDERWLKRFAGGSHRVANRHDVALIGGDLSRGPLAVTVQAGGRVSGHAGLRRDGAGPGDRVYLSGTLGDAALGLKVVNGEYAPPPAVAARLARALHRPEPALKASRCLVGVASAVIDVSDGLLADLGHVLRQSGGLGARIEIESLPLSRPVARYLKATGDVETVLAGGDDYVLCFCVPQRAVGRLEARLSQAGLAARAIGSVTGGGGIEVLDREGRTLRPARPGFDHFR